MKRIFIILSAVFLNASMFAQSPEKMSYQAVVRDASDNLVTNQQVGMQISILQGSATGTVVYTETQTPTTNANGLVTIEIGTGTTTDDFSAIDWSNGLYFIKTETDPAGGTNYTITGTSQLLSVPYALHSKTAENLTGTISETDPVYTESQASNITETDITNLSNLSGTNTGDQDLSGLATQSALEDTASAIRTDFPDVNNFITTETDPIFGTSVASGITGTDTSKWNNKLDSYAETDPEFSSWDKSYNDLSDKPSIIDSVNTVLDTTSQFVRIETDGDATNEIQMFSVSATGDTLYLSASNWVIIPDISAAQPQPLTDYDGNVYQTVVIGNQEWMAENLKTTHYADGTSLIDGTGAGDITGDYSTKYYFWYDDDSTANAETYGALYTWTAIMNDSASSSSNPSRIQGVCPTGWHLPSDDEWKELEMYLGMSQTDADLEGLRGTNEGSKLAENASLWSDGALENDAEFGSSGLQALPGGGRYYDGTFYNLGNYARFWSATKYNNFYAWYHFLHYNTSGVYRIHVSNNIGFSVRCLQD